MSCSIVTNSTINAVKRDLRKDCQRSVRTARADLQCGVVPRQHEVTSHGSTSYSTATVVRDSCQGPAALKVIDQGHRALRTALMTRSGQRARHVSKVTTAADQCLIRQVSCKPKKVIVQCP